MLLSTVSQPIVAIAAGLKACRGPGLPGASVGLLGGNSHQANPLNMRPVWATSPWWPREHEQQCAPL
jgi:hypothetical protein